MFSTHRAANAVGAFIGPLSAGLLAYYFGWRVPFLVFVIPTVIFAVLATRLREPTRGRWERQATGASQDDHRHRGDRPSFAESWRTAHKMKSLQRIWWSLPFLATSLIGFVTLASLLYEQKFGLDERGRGVAAAVAEPFALVGLVVGARIATRRFIGDVKGLIRFLASIAVLTSVASAGFAFAPNVVIAVALNCVISAALAIVGPGILAALSLAIPPRARATGFASPRCGSSPVWPSCRSSAGSPTTGASDRDAHPDPPVRHRQPHPAQRRRRDRRRHRPGVAVVRGPHRGAVRAPAGHTPTCCSLRGVDAGYGNRTGAVRRRHRRQGGRDRRPARHQRRRQEHAAEVDQRHRRGRPRRGRARRPRHHPRTAERDRRARHRPDARRPGRVRFAHRRENLELAGWTHRRDPTGVAAATAEVLEMFPVLAQPPRLACGELSGGQQQMLALGDELRDAARRCC